MSTFVITPEDVGRSVKMRHGGIGWITEYDYERTQPVCIEDENGVGRYYTNGIYSLVKSPSKHDAVAWADEQVTEQPSSFDSGYVQKKLGESFSKYSLPNTGTLNHVDVQTTKQVRPKDLRDEFAMSVIASIVGNQDYYEMPNPDKVKWVDRVAQYAYVFADAMMKAREEK